jgi:hypothetical protein
MGPAFDALKALPGPLVEFTQQESVIEELQEAVARFVPTKFTVHTVYS